MTIRFLLQLVFLFLTVAVQAAGGGSFTNENGSAQVIETTDSHPFWVVTGNPELWRAAQEVVNEDGTLLYHENLGVTENGYWVEAKDLREGDVFVGANGGLSYLVSKERVEFAEGITVYNFTVDGNHDYFVIAQTAELGQTCILVHNAGCGNGYANSNISRQKQDGHILGTREYERRLKMHKPTSYFSDKETAENLINIAKDHGTPVPGRNGIVLEYEFDYIIGTRINGQPTNKVRVHIDQNGNFHGYPY